MKIFGVAKSHNCRRVIATADHLGLEYELVEPNLMTGDHKKPEYLAVNPNGKIPALQDGEFKLWESNAIMQYLASKQPTSLWPDDGAVRAQIASWQFWEVSQLSKGTSGLTFEKVFKVFMMKKEADPAAVEAATKVFHDSAPVLNGQLEGKDFIMGGALTLADFSVGANFSYAGPAGIPLDNYPHIKRWLDGLDGVKAWKDTAPKMG